MKFTTVCWKKKIENKSSEKHPCDSCTEAAWGQQLHSMALGWRGVPQGTVFKTELDNQSTLDAVMKEAWCHSSLGDGRLVTEEINFLLKFGSWFFHGNFTCCFSFCVSWWCSPPPTDGCLASDVQVWCSSNTRWHFNLYNIVESINADLVYWVQLTLSCQGLM